MLDHSSSAVRPPEISSPRRPRLDSVDLLRGLVMVIMALDHVRDYFTNVRFDPLDLTHTSAELFMTRWITHFCAPAFVFLAGTGAFLSSTRGKTKPELSKFLLTRGLWLVVVELTIVRFGWLFNLDYHFSVVQVIWAIGWSMVALSALIYLPISAITIFGIVMIAIHNLFDRVSPSQFGSFALLWQILHVSTSVEIIPGYVCWVAYPLIPWIGVMAAGYGFGSLLLEEESHRRKLLVRIGLAAILLFILIRYTNAYGDPHPWSAHKHLLFSIFSFIDCEKYPASLLYLLMTLGPALVALAYFERIKGAAADFFIVFGRVPFFYYIIHIPLIHGLAVIAAYVSGINPGFMFSNAPPWEWMPEYGFGLPVVYLVWAGAVLGLYPACRWFAGVKKRNKNPWLSYF